MREITVRCQKSGNVYTMHEISTAEATDAFAMAAALPIVVHYSVGLAIKTMNGHPWPQFYNIKREAPNAMAVRIPLEGIPEGDMNKLFNRYDKHFASTKEERAHEVQRLDGGVVRVKSVRHGHDYELKELNSVRSGDAISMGAGVGSATHYRMAFALVKMDGTDVPYMTSNRVVRDLLWKIPLSDMELMNFHYNQEFTSTDDDEDDLGNELTLDSPGLD